jgi:hypothetical protein
MKKLWFSCLILAAMSLPLSGLLQTAQALDTVVVGQPYYGGYAPYYGGGYYPNPYYAPYVYPPANPAMQAGAIGSNPYFLGSQVYLNRGNTTRGEVRNAFQKTAPIFLTPNPVDYNTGYNQGYYPGYYGGYGNGAYPY